MSCPKNEILAAWLLLNKDSRDQIIKLSEDINRLPDFWQWKIERWFLQDEISRVAMESILDSWASSVAKASLLDKFSKNFSKYNRSAQVAKVDFLRKLWTADISTNWNMAKQVMWYLDIDWNETFKQAKKSIERWLVFDYLATPSSVPVLYKKIVWWEKNWEEAIKEIKDKLSKMSDEEIDSALSSDEIYQSIKIEDGDVKSAVDSLILYSSVLWRDKAWIAQAIKFIKKSGGWISSKEVQRAIAQIDSVSKFKDFIIRYKADIKNAANESDIAEDLSNKADSLAWKSQDWEVNVVADLVSKMEDPNASSIDDLDVLDAVQQSNMSIASKLNAIWNIQLLIDWEDVFKNVDISNEDIERIIGYSDAENLRIWVDTLIKDMRDKYKSWRTAISTKLEKKKKKLVEERDAIEKELRAMWSTDEWRVSMELRLEAKKQEIIDTGVLIDSASEHKWIIQQTEQFKEFNRWLAKIREIAYNKWSTIINSDEWGVLLSYLSRWANFYNKEWKIDMKSVWFLQKNRWAQPTWIDKELWDLYSQAYWANAIGIGNVEVFDSIESLTKAVKEWRIKNVVVSSQDDMNNKDIKKFISDTMFDESWFHYPKSETLQGWFFVDWNELKYSSANTKYINNLREELLNVGINNEIRNWWANPIEIADRVLQKKYNLQKEEIDRIVKDMWLSGRYSAYDIEKQRWNVSKINQNIRQEPINIADVKKDLLDLSDEDINSRLKEKIISLWDEFWLWITWDEADTLIKEISNNEDKVDVYMMTSYGKNLSDIADAEVQLIWMIRKDFAWDKVLSEAEKQSVAFRALNQMYADWIQLPYKINYNMLFDNAMSWKSPSKRTVWELKKANPDMNMSASDISDLVKKYYIEQEDKFVKVSATEWWRWVYFVKDNRLYWEALAKTPSEVLNEEAVWWLKQLVKRTDKLRSNVIKAIKAYKDEVLSEIEKSGWAISKDKSQALKNKLIKTLRQNEIELDRVLVRANTMHRSKTFVFWAPSITEAWSVNWFNGELDKLAYKYDKDFTSEVDMYKQALEWNKEIKLPNWKVVPLDEAFRDMPWKPVLVDGKIDVLKKWTEINNAIDCCRLAIRHSAHFLNITSQLVPTSVTLSRSLAYQSYTCWLKLASLVAHLTCSLIWR